MKYVVLEYMGLETIYVFPDYVTHRDFVQQMVGDTVPAGDVISAGFLEVSADSDCCLIVRAYGDSVSLGVKSRPQDTQLAHKLF